MYLPPHFKIDELGAIHAAMRASRLATLVTATTDGLIGTPLPLILDPREGEYGTLYGHVARPNPQWKLPPTGEAMAIFTGPDAYVTPSWYATKAEHGKVVPTWNYLAVHAYGAVEFFEDADRLLDVVTRLTEQHERSRAEAWQVSDAPADFIKAQLRGIVGLKMPITRLDAKKKMSQNRKAEDRAGVIAGLGASNDPVDREVAAMIPME
ncbi:FMN-binding negative transcriptional regulator [Bradyrhizobium ivorense]|uniref:FMN-binding negative transcriptional regulator n=1 Tax=Bradyrhizobium ivorense TaxID=2511166 RepID=UPI0010B51BD4|nr:FMN-binding negative transcriptional regulator [Bradyrhizobium ivorense]VIO80636.1 Protease synthase and sporulation protein PAI 2 [Bradyrhizobium ivorense]